MVELNQEAATRAKDAMNLAQHSAVLLVVEVAIGGEPAHNRVEVVNPWKCPHVTRHVLNRNSPDSSVGARPLQKLRRHVESGDVRTVISEPVRDSPVSAREVEHFSTRLDV